VKHITSIEILTNQGQFELCNRSGGTLSPISLDILDCLCSKTVTIILSQGPLNLTPLISAIFAWYFKRDVLVGLPAKDFKKRYDRYTQTFFSLLYEQSSHFFFYKDVLWVEGELDESYEELRDLNIETYPKHGNTVYKKKYDSQIREELTKGSGKQKPFIVFIPTQRIPAGVVGQKLLKYENEKYRKTLFDPGLLVLESVNEGAFNLESISSLIKNIKRMGKKLILHFSWPYLRGLDNFLNEQLNQSDSKVAVFHLGKRLCLEWQDYLTKPAPFAVPISLESELWNTAYYPGKGAQLDYKVFLPLFHTPLPELDENALVNFDSTNDNWQQSIREHIVFERVQDTLAENIVLFPPAIDSFLYPSEVKIRFRRPEGNFVYVPLQDYIAEKFGQGSTIRRLYGGLSQDLQHSRDLSYELRGLSTYSAASKKTLLQEFVLDAIQTGIDAMCEQIAGNETPQYNGNVVMLNLYPLLGSRGSLLDSIDHLLESVSILFNRLTLPKVFIEDDAFKLRFENTNGSSYFVEASEVDSRKLAKYVTHDLDVPVSVDYINHTRDSEVTISLDVDSGYFEFDPKSEQRVNKRRLRPLVLYRASKRQGDNFRELTFRGLRRKRYPHLNRLQIIVDLVFRTSNAANESTLELNLVYLEPYQIKRMTRDQIIHSQLIIPGAIPFFTITDDALMICEHFDTLLLPFERIVFFAYPGNNFRRILRQIRSYNDIFSEEPTLASNIDLGFSLKHTTLSKRMAMLESCRVLDNAEYKIEGDTAIDVAIRQNVMQTAANYVEQQEIITLRGIWERIRKPQKVDAEWGCDGTRIFFTIDRKSQMTFRVAFDGNRIEDISFESGTLLRKKIGADYEICPVEELSTGDEILYIESSERESVDNYLLRDFTIQKEIQLEHILEPATSLKLFYEAIKSLKTTDISPPEKMKTLYWLTDRQKTSLISTLRSAMQCSRDLQIPETVSNNRSYSLNSDHFWSDFLEFSELVSIFGKGSKNVTYLKLFDIAKKAGVRLQPRSFAALCSSAIHEHKHYFFRDTGSLLGLGKLLGHQDLIKNYELINELGKDIGTTLQIIGRCVARVSSGRTDLLNQMDASIEDKIRRCHILNISS